MKDAFKISNLGGKLLYAQLAGSKAQITKFSAGTSRLDGDRLTTGLLEPVFNGNVSYFTFIDLHTVVVHLLIPGDAALADKTELSEFSLASADGQLFAIAELQTPVVFDKGRDADIEIPLLLQEPDAAKIDTLTVAEKAHLPATTLDALPAPGAINTSAVVVHGVRYDGVERPLLAFKHTAGASRWAFSDHEQVAQVTPRAAGENLTELELDFDLYDNEQLLMFIAVGVGYGTTRQVMFVRETVGAVTTRKLLVLGAPVTVGLNSLLLLHRAMHNQLPPIADVPEGHVLMTGKAQSSSKNPNQLRLRFQTAWLDAGEAALTLTDYSVRKSRDFVDQHLVLRDGKLLAPGAYVFVNERLVFNETAKTKTPIMVGVFESSDSNDSTLLSFSVAANQASVQEVASYPNQIVAADATALFTSTGLAETSLRLYLDGATFRFVEPPSDAYQCLTQTETAGVQRYSYPVVYRGTVPPGAKYQLPKQPTGMLCWIDGALDRKAALEENSNEVRFDAGDIGKNFAVLVVFSQYAETAPLVRNYKWGNPQGTVVDQSVSVQKFEFGALTKGQTVAVPGGDSLLVFCDGAKLPVEQFTYKPHVQTLTTKRAGKYTVLLVNRTHGDPKTTKLRKHYLTSTADVAVVAADPKSTFLVFVGNWQQPEADYTLTRNANDVSFRVNSSALLNKPVCLVEFYTVNRVGTESGFCLHRRFQERDYYPLADTVAKDALLVFANAVYVPDDLYTVSFYEGSAILDVSVDYGIGYDTEVFGLHAAVKPDTVTQADLEKLTNLFLFS